MEPTTHKDAQGESRPGLSIAGAMPFFFGLALSLISGWLFFPDMLFSSVEQPLQFSHVTHTETVGMECANCHYFREDGTFNGIPTTAECADCHSEAMGWDEEEVRFVKEYVALGKEVDWKVYQYQPDNAFFTHTAHSMESCNRCHEFTEPELCGQCHPDVANMDGLPPYRENRITGYSKDTMKMTACEECHTLPLHYEHTGSPYGQSCHSCHK